jgi:hypothetical protein
VEGRPVSLMWLGARRSLIWSINYDGSVLGQMWDPLEWWFSFATPGPLSDSAMHDSGLGAAGFV